MRLQILQVKDVRIRHRHHCVECLADPSFAVRPGFDQNVAILAAVGGKKLQKVGP
jgi:hypothetical protein